MLKICYTFKENPLISQVSTLKLNIVENLGDFGKKGDMLFKFNIQKYVIANFENYVFVLGRVGNVVRSNMDKILTAL